MERIEGSELQIGYCSDCGQAKQFQTSGGVSQDQLNEWATDECKCEAGKERRRIKQSHEKALKNIDKLFGERFPETAQILNDSLEFVIMDVIDSITIKTGYGVDAKLSITSKGKVNVESKQTHKVLLEE